MISGIYASASGLLTLFSRQLTINNNLANINTTGYKQDIPEETPFPELYLQRINDVTANGSTLSAAPQPVGTLGMGVGIGGQTMDMSQGSLEETNNALDMALNGPGFFQVQTPDGIRYTRDGAFVRDPQGQLTTVRGDLILGANGLPLTLANGNVQVDKSGAITVDGQAAGQLGIVEFPTGTQMTKNGQNMLVPAAPTTPAAAQTTSVQQGFLERSNVDPTKAMVDMMSVARAYEASQRMLQFQDQSLDQAVNEIAKF